METIFEELTGYLWRQGIHIAVLFGAIAIACWILRKRTAHWRYLLWLVIVAKCLVPSLMTVSLAVLPQKAAAVKPVLAEVPIVIDMPADVAPKYVVSVEKPVAETKESSLVAWLGDRTTGEWFGMIWLGGIIMFTLVVSVKAVRFHHRLKCLREPVCDGLYGEICELAAEGTAPKVWMLTCVGQPFVWGLLQGSIYLPGSFRKSTDAEHRRKIMAHELAHVTRYDAFVNLLQTLAQGIFWFHPLVWIANRQIRAEREKCCDETAIARLAASPKDYSNAIVDTLITEYKSTLPTPSLAIAGPIRNIEDRIKTIMKPGKRFYKSPTLVAIVVVLLLGVAVVPTTIALTERRADIAEPAVVVEDKQEEPVTKAAVEKALDSQVVEEQVLIDLQLISVESKETFYRDRLGVEAPGTTLVLSKKQKDRLEDMSLSPAGIEWIARPKVLINDRSTAKLNTTRSIDNPDKETKQQQYKPEFDIAITPHVSRKGVIRLELEISLKAQTGVDDSGKAIITTREIVTMVAVDNGKTTLLELAGGTESEKAMFVVITPVVLEPSQEECEELSAIEESDQLRPLPDEEMVGTWFFNNPSGDEEQMSIFPDGRVVVIYSNGHRDEIKLKDGVIEFKEYGGLKGKLRLAEADVILQRSANPDSGGEFIKSWERIDEEPKTELLRSLTGKSDDDEVKQVLSASKMRRLALAWYMYADNNDDRIAGSLKDLEPYIEKEAFSWIAENVEYIAKPGKFTEITAPQNRPIAYDRLLLRQLDGTNVAFADGHAEYVAIKDFDKIKYGHLLVEAIKWTGDGKKAVKTEGWFLSVNEDYLEAVGLDRESAGDSITFLSKKESELKIKAITSSGPIDKQTSVNVPVEAAFVEDSQVKLLIKATQKHKESSLLAAPTVEVMDAEEAVIKVIEEIPFVAGYKDGHTFTTMVEAGTTLSITPQVTADSKHFVLALETIFSELSGYDRRRYRGMPSYDVPRMDVLELKCKGLYVPVGKTLLMYAPRYSSDDKKVMLILVKPRISEAEVD